MWIIIATSVPVALAFYGLARLQQIRNSHGAQGRAGSAFTFSQFYKHENPALHRQATMLQSAEEQEAEAYKYRVKWDNEEEREQDFALLSPIDVDTASGFEEAKHVGKRKGKRVDVKWDEFEA